jgi:hypothetical protein
MSNKIVRYKIIKDDSICNKVYELGYAILGNVGNYKLDELKKLYKQEHDFKTSDGGMFYSIYSLNLVNIERRFKIILKKL